MSSKNLDDLFQENLNGRNFKPSESGWTNMEQMLDDQHLDALFSDKLGARQFKPTRSGWRKAAAMLPNSGAGIWFGSGMRIAAGLASAIAIAGLGYLSLPEDSHEMAYEPRLQSKTEFESSEIEYENTEERFQISENQDHSESTSVKPKRDTENGSTAYLDKEHSPEVESNQTDDTEDSSNSSVYPQTRSTSAASSNFSTPILANANSRVEQGVRLAALGAELSLENTSKHDLNATQNGFVYLDSYKNPKPLIKHRLGIIGGLNLARGFESGTNAGNLSANLFGGVTYNYFVHPKWVLHADILYQARTGIETAKVLQAKTYNFGSTRDVLTMHNKKLHYLELPVHLGYRISKNMQVLAGVNFAYLVGCSNEMVHEYQGPFEAWTKTTTEQSLPEGMNRLDVGISAGVAYEISSAMEFGARMNYGLTDVTDDEYFSSIAVDRNLQFRLHLAYRFLRF